MKRQLIAIGLLLLPLGAKAAPDYKYCEIAGLANGADKEFVGSVASRLVSKQGLMGDSSCVAVWTDAYKKGERMAANPSGWSALDMVAWQKLQDFETLVLDALIKNMNLEG